MRPFLKSSLDDLLATLFMIMVTFGISSCHAGTPFSLCLEKTYVQTDREIYIAGDCLFFKVYVVDNFSNLLSVKSKLVYISLRNEDNHIISKARVSLVRGMACGSIELPDTLSTGYYQLQSFTNCMRNDDESAYYSRELFIANQFDKDLMKLSKMNTTSIGARDTLYKVQDSSGIDKNLKLGTDKYLYYNREKVSLSLEMKGLNPNTLTDLSVSVYEQTPELLPNVSISEYLKPVNGNRTDDPYEGQSTSNQYLTEFQGQIIQGKVLNADVGKPMAGVPVFLSAADTFANLKYTNTDSTGKFRFLLENYYNNKPLVFKVQPVSAFQKCKIIFDDKFSFKHGFTPICFSDTTHLKNYIYTSQNILKIHKVYHSKIKMTNTQIKNNPAIHRPYPQEVYERPNLIIRPAEYQFLPDFLEITRELIHTLIIRKKEGKYECFFIDTTLHKNMEGDPMIFLDGILMDDINPIIALNSDQISRIDCLNTQRILGSLSCNGILAVFTRKMESDHVQNPNNIRFSVEAPLPVSTYYSPDYQNNSQTTIPEYRQLLYWNPTIEIKGDTQKSFDFYASDQSGTYIIKVDGITSDGRTIQASTQIEIKTSQN